jgi:hypothetical protein
MNRTQLAAFSGLCILGGCSNPRNEGLALHDSVLMEALGPPGPGIALTGDSPSVTKIDRSDWEVTPIAVPVDGTAHYPTYVRVRSLVRETARQRGVYPMEESALDQGGETEDSQQAEGLVQPLRVLSNTLLLPIRMIFYRWPWENTLQSPRGFYERYWIRPGAESESVTATAPPP